MMRFLFTFLTVFALAVGCNNSSSDNKAGNSPAITGNQVSFDVTGMT